MSVYLALHGRHCIVKNERRVRRDEWLPVGTARRPGSLETRLRAFQGCHGRGRRPLCPARDRRMARKELCVLRGNVKSRRMLVRAQACSLPDARRFVPALLSYAWQRMTCEVNKWIRRRSAPNFSAEGARELACARASRCVRRREESTSDKDAPRFKWAHQKSGRKDFLVNL
jgi:hypothetical protein